MLSAHHRGGCGFEVGRAGIGLRATVRFITAAAISPLPHEANRCEKYRVLGMYGFPTGRFPSQMASNNITLIVAASAIEDKCPRFLDISH